MLATELTVAQLYGLMVISTISVFLAVLCVRFLFAEDTSTYHRICCVIGLLGIFGGPGLWGYEVIAAIGDPPR